MRLHAIDSIYRDSSERKKKKIKKKNGIIIQDSIDPNLSSDTRSMITGILEIVFA